MNSRIKWMLLVALGLLWIHSRAQQTVGCTDPAAANFAPAATLNDGSCRYERTSYQPVNRQNLPEALVEVSGMAWWNGRLWMLNDGGHGPFLYAADSSTGTIRQRVHLPTLSNVDWEALAQDSLHFYLADVGNNASGNRRNLVIYQVPKAAIGPDSLVTIPDSIVGRIFFTYADQADFSPAPANQTAFDCESVLFSRDSLHLFTKNWLGGWSKHYVLPANPGNHTALLRDSVFTDQYLLTDVAAGGYDSWMFTAYNRSGGCAMLLVFGFGSSYHPLVDGNRRWLQLPSSLTMGQLEAICFRNPASGYLGSERLTRSFVNVPQRMFRFESYPFLLPFYRHRQITYAESGMLRYNSTEDVFEYFDGKAWQRW